MRIRVIVRILWFLAIISHVIYRCCVDNNSVIVYVLTDPDINKETATLLY